MKLVLPYDDPEMDGAAAAYAYAEFLKETEEDGRIVGAAFGDAEDEAALVLKHLDEELSDASYYLYNADSMILVDPSGTGSLSTRIKPDDVVEIVDNEESDIADRFSNAELQIEEVGATSTLVAEKFYEHREDIEITEESALMLYMAISLETDHLSNDKTTDRDKEMLEWLEGMVEVPEELEEKVLDEEARDGDELVSEYD